MKNFSLDLISCWFSNVFNLTPNHRQLVCYNSETNKIGIVIDLKIDKDPEHVIQVFGTVSKDSDEFQFDTILGWL